MSNQTSNIIVPTDPVQLKKIRDAVQEGCDCLTRTDAEKALLKDIIGNMSEEFDIPKQYLSRLIKQKHNSDFDEKVAEQDDFEVLYEAVFTA